MSATAAARCISLGLLGNGGVHAPDKHFWALLDLAESQRIRRVAIHAMLDGRDTLPRSALGFMRETIERAQGRARIASIGGRYFGMDRDRRWQRTELFYRAAIDGTGPQIGDPLAAISGRLRRRTER